MRTEDQYTGAPVSYTVGDAYGFDVVNVVARPQVLPKHAHTLRSPAVGFNYVVLKRALDVFACFALTPVLLPLCGLIYLAIKINSPGPVFFTHRRIRKDGGFFSMWKFRTMCTDSAEVLERYLEAHPEAREEWAKTHKLRKDPRVTRLGRMLRRSSLDELPQIWNVLSGEMSLVGPRPIVASEVEKYGECFTCYCSVKPGVTGLWQVSGRSEVTYAERVALDCRFVHEWSLWMDIKILIRTISTVINSDGAY